MAREKALNVAEKPSIAKSVSNILSHGSASIRTGPSKYNRNFDFSYSIRGRDYEMTMTSVSGHIMELDFPETYQKWTSCPAIDLFMAPVVKTVHKDMKEAQANLENEIRGCSLLIIWTDCDREGENIGHEIAMICQKRNTKVRILRARFSAIIPRDIHKACQDLQELDMNQVHAADARMELDLRIGAAFTRYQTLRLQPKFPELVKKVISYGPCQFPTLGFVVDRYWKVENFISEPFWFIEVTYEKNGELAKFTWKRHHVFDRWFCLIMYEACVENPLATVTNVDSKPTVKWRPLPLTTVELQKSGSRLLKMSSDEVMKTAESLYTNGYISYPRTETNIYDPKFDLKTLIERQATDTSWGTYARSLLDGKYAFPRKGKHNDKAHPPIHPTKSGNDLAGPSRKLFEFIARHFLASCSEDAKGRSMKVTIEISGESFEASGLTVLEKNFLEVFPYEKWSDVSLPDFQIRERFIPTQLLMNDGKTSPPSLLTEADLISLMDKNGIGTDATIHEHIKKILEREYAFKEGIYFKPSTLGCALVEAYDSMSFDASLAKPFLRAQMEADLKLICDGHKIKTDVVGSSIEMYRDVLVRAQNESIKLEHCVAKYLGTQPLNSNA